MNLVSKKVKKAVKNGLMNGGGKPGKSPTVTHVHQIYA